ncbi:Gfo/Idh/MocA family protein [Tuwongella immobilis]|uniref:Gfo/Idh/MocA-like oxidoreductase N-terminal domain-containing protein n=1 Tax=Tuwongella immobilis TaxID=692036 RepID=A0A6C2YR20_9BACT|nr:Gfo/Idh/MocA family oxidoreductase [Tuwongella immobilis]VIP03435.1 oxidoreductase : Oxidoreductase domain protein OS=Pedosphaera parvula (strain Ellin514) GN=Cflav_PD3751 PE=4 SV=1: GFO_IDH_MocA [Tuwongella immobilis]VTS04242.1 oxidoreductase : Oxidoreductase domain protein OS=Pedosphaera parvula (strain Ellin514) GN=Cflav_PD3751 PE=4 SV=1: GFO_IDH_MocA [Tuwongella immobilis]
MSNTLSRRHFLQQSLALGVGSLAVGAMPSIARSANEKLHVGVIGCAGQGQYNWTNIAASGAEIVAVCDVDQPRLGAITKAHPKAAIFEDFRKLLDQKGIDAVVVSTPDHTHAIATVAALNSGRHVYCEKPLTHNVFEARVVAETAKKTGKVTQMGTQIHAGDNYRRVVEIIQSGAIGDVTEVHVMSGKSWGGGDRPKDTPPVPKGLNFDLWLGPAPTRPYHPIYVPFNWRAFWDFGGGTLADMACHHMDLPFWALKLRHPTKITAEGPAAHPETAAKSLIVTYEYAARDKMPPVKLMWYDGGNRPKVLTENKISWGDGSVFVGTKGMLLADYGSYKLLPEKDFDGFTPPKPTIPRSIGHHREFVEACKTGGPTTCNFDYSGALTEAVLLGNVAFRVGKPIEWDAVNLKAKGLPEADAFLRREYRAGWKLG